MTKEFLKERFPILQAIVEEKIIQFEYPKKVKGGIESDWADLKFFGIDMDLTEDLSQIVLNPEVKVRIKPIPELIPFDFDDAEFLIGRIVINKSNKSVNIITKIYDNGIIASIHLVFYPELLRDYTFEDGKPCGRYSNEYKSKEVYSIG